MKTKLRARNFIYLSAASFLVASTCALGQDNLTSTIAAAEKILLGASVNTGTVEERLSAVEQKLYGKPKKGPLLKRMQAVAEMLRIDTVQAANRDAAATVAGDAGSPPSTGQSPSVAATPVSEPVKPPLPAPSTPLAYPAEPENEQTDKDQLKPAKWKGLLPPTTPAPANLAGTSARHQTGKGVELKPQAAKMDMPPLAPSIPRARSVISAAPPSAALSKQDQARNLLRQGLKLHAQGLTAQAEGLFRRVLTIDPRNADAFFNLGSIAEARKDLVTALTDYRAALNLKPGEPDFQNAVAAIERELNENNNGLTGDPSSQRFTAPDLAGDATLTGTGSPLKPFQLQSTQNDALLNAQSPTAVPLLNAQFPGAPSMNVGSPSAVPVLNVSSANRTSHKLSTVLSVGTYILLQGSGLHCPICRIMRGF